MFLLLLFLIDRWYEIVSGVSTPKFKKTYIPNGSMQLINGCTLCAQPPLGGRYTINFQFVHAAEHLVTFP